MTQLAKMIKLPLVKKRCYTSAVHALTFGSKGSTPQQRRNAIEFFGKICERADAVMVLGNALADFGDFLKDEERIEIARALRKAPANSLSRELALSFLNRACQRELSQAVKNELMTALAELST